MTTNPDKDLSRLKEKAEAESSKQALLEDLGRLIEDNYDYFFPDA